MKYISALQRLTTAKLITDYICRPFLKFDCFQTFVNVNANKKCLQKLVPSPEIENYDNIFENNFNDIQKDDIVLDIGANIGGFSLFVSRFVKHVYAVEPLWYDMMKENIKLNNIKNITVFDKALGNGLITVSYNKKRTLLGSSLTELINMCGGHVDFLKCDCEGAEWIISPDELKPIRRIEMEVHNLDKHTHEEYLNLFSNAAYKSVSANDPIKHRTHVHIQN